MTRVAVVAVGNQNQPKDMNALKRLIDAGYQVELFYYLDKVPAQMTMIPSMNAEIASWHRQGLTQLKAIGEQFGIRDEHRHFVDEILGSDEVFNQARTMHARVILTGDKGQLHESTLNRWFDTLQHVFNREAGKAIPVENMDDYVASKLGVVRPFQRKGQAANVPSHTERKTGTKG